MARHIRRRFWGEAALGAASAVLLVLTLIWNDWIELVFRISPDEGNGAVEWLVVAFAFGVLMTSMALARYEWRKAAVHAA
jgi:hypothetical protein